MQINIATVDMEGEEILFYRETESQLNLGWLVGQAYEALPFEGGRIVISVDHEKEEQLDFNFEGAIV